MLIALNLKAPALKSSPYLALVAKTALNAMVRANQLYLASETYAGRKVPALYQSGVRYAEEPWNRDGQRVEEFADIPTILARKWGDCDDLAPWRCAELRMQGEPAKIRITWQPTPKGRLFHVVVRRANGAVEDPSRILGMGRG